MLAIACGESTAGTREDGNGSAATGGSSGSTASGGSGATGASSATGGSGAGGVAGSAGSASALVTMCAPGRYSTGDFGVSDVLETVQGDNGTFTDECDAMGNLTQYGCAFTLEQIGSPPANAFPQTGAVTSKTVDCGGRCRGGVCPNVCPADGDLMRYSSVGADGNTALADLTSGWTYSCSLYTSGSSDDCQTFAAGDEIEVLSGGTGCANGASFILGGGPTYCYYMDCVVTPP